MISVIVPTYNRSKVLPRAIESVLSQTFKDWELIIVDDGSNDGTQHIIEDYITHYSRINYYWFLNMGASVARNIGVSLSKGELIAFLDSDDVWTPGRLQSIYDVHLQNPELNQFYITDFRSSIAETSLIQEKNLYNKNFLQNLYAINFLGGTINMVIPRKFLFDLEGFDTSLTSTEDHELYVRLAENYKCFYVPGEFAIYFLDTSNRISGKNQKRLLGQLAYYKKHKSKMSLLTKLLVMKKNALLAYYIKSPVYLRYLHAWIIVALLKKLYNIEDEMKLYTINSWVLNNLNA